MSTPTIRDVERAICCPRGQCQSPGACDMKDRTRSHLVDIGHAAQAVAQLYCEAWRNYTANSWPAQPGYTERSWHRR